MIQATGIHKYFDQLHVLKGVNLHISKGEIIAIVGKPGEDIEQYLNITAPAAHDRCRLARTAVLAAVAASAPAAVAGLPHRHHARLCAHRRARQAPSRHRCPCHPVHRKHHQHCQE